MKYVNLGILAHIDAGKTTLTERLLFNAGVISDPGSVDKGSTQTDSMDLERRRGITIRSAVVSFPLRDLTVNVIDTPGHSDFISEVERAVAALDGAIVVVSAVEGIQPQTRVLLRTLHRLQLPTMLFVNKIDRVGAQYDSLMRSIAEVVPLPLSMSQVSQLGTRSATATPRQWSDEAFLGEVENALADSSDSFLEAFVDPDRTVSLADYRAELALQVHRRQVCPVFFGSAMTGTGVESVADGIAEFLTVHKPPSTEALTGTVFKVDRGTANQRVAFVRLHSGDMARGDRFEVYRHGAHGQMHSLEGKATSVQVFYRGAKTIASPATPGSIAQVWGLPNAQVGDAIGSPERLARRGLFAEPTMETVIYPVLPRLRRQLHEALQSLADRDPMVRPHLDGDTGDLSIKLYGEVQKEVIAALVEEEFDIEVGFANTRPLYIERPVGTGECTHHMGRWADTHFLATVGFRVTPGESGSGVTYDMEVERGSLIPTYRTAVEETVHQTLQQGLNGWPVTDCLVELTASGYDSELSHAHDFRDLVPIILLRSLQAAGTEVLEPVNQFNVEFPVSRVSAVNLLLAQSGASVLSQDIIGERTHVVGQIATADQPELERRLPHASQGEAALLSHFDGHRPVTGEYPRRPRTDGNPLHLKEYLTYLRNA